MKKILWDHKKSAWLKNHPNRGRIGFEECAIAIEAGAYVDDIENPSSNHPDQGCFLLNFDSYIYVVPYLETDDQIFLKTVYPSRKFTALYLSKAKS